MRKIGLFLFDHDCRVQNNLALQQLCQQVDELICVYWLKPTREFVARYSQAQPSAAQRQFLRQTLESLNQSLAPFAQRLIVLDGNLSAHIQGFIDKLTSSEQCLSHIARTAHCGWYENQQWQALQHAFPHITFLSEHHATLFAPEHLPFSLDKLPPSFTPFRQQVEHLNIAVPVTITSLPPSPKLVLQTSELWPVGLTKPEIAQQGQDTGQDQAQATAVVNTQFARAEVHLHDYFATRAASDYKQTRNALAGHYFSTQFSPYLAHGSLSPRQIMQALKAYEAKHSANESTYWIFFELLWREYFYYAALAKPRALFFKGGAKERHLDTEFNAQRFRQWCEGNTDYPLVNALMHELAETGWISNRGRQIVASCLVNELGLDWRYGAAYFEQCLLDYDVASNWGNWQYIAGVGADPRGGRHFSIEKQTALYDPQGSYIKKWTSR
jgi:deoxyribodipyrimidine photo-lyase